MGVFAVRGAGEVFLTEEDLEFTESHGASLALILAGERGGFCVREPDGVFLTIRSHEEFVAPDPTHAQKRTSLRTWANVAALLICVAVTVGAVSYAEPKAALALNVHDEAGQLAIEWSPRVKGTLTIQDGDRSVEIPVSAYETRATLAPQGSKITIRLDSSDGLTREEHIEMSDRPCGSSRNTKNFLRRRTKTPRSASLLEKQLHP